MLSLQVSLVIPLFSPRPPAEMSQKAKHFSPSPQCRLHGYRSRDIRNPDRRPDGRILGPERLLLVPLHSDLLRQPGSLLRRR